MPILARVPQCPFGLTVRLRPRRENSTCASGFAVALPGVCSLGFCVWLPHTVARRRARPGTWTVLSCCRRVVCRGPSWCQSSRSMSGPRVGTVSTAAPPTLWPTVTARSAACPLLLRSCRVWPVTSRPGLRQHLPADQAHRPGILPGHVPLGGSTPPARALGRGLLEGPGPKMARACMAGRKTGARRGA